jgi:UDP-N-acetylglucosamine acyltransferase
MPTIHPTAIIDANATLAPDVEIGPHVVIEGPVVLDAGVRVLAHAVLTGHTHLASECVVHPFAAIGGVPQDVAYKGEVSYVRIGARTIIREGVTIHRGTGEETETRVGADCLLFAGTHIAHNCVIGDRVTIINNVLLAGHVHIGDRAVLGGSVGVHQFCRIGEYAMIGGMARLSQDAPPFMTHAPEGGCVGINRVGLRRANFDSATIEELRMLHRHLFRSGRALRNALSDVAEDVHTDAGKRLIAFLSAPSKRGFVRCRRGEHFAPTER